MADPASAPLHLLRTKLATPLAGVEARILACTGHPLALIRGPASHLLGAGGKRIRPLLTLAFAAALGQVSPAGEELAAAVELLHAATLLHDDVLDNSMLRRGRETANALWDNKVSILVGDFLFACAFRHMTAAGSPAALDVLSSAARDIVAGELLQLSLAGRVPTREEYFQVLHAKTSVLFAAAAEAGAITAGVSDDLRAAARAFGEHFGTVFQIVDDVLDYTGDPRELGKPAGSDVREGKLTLPALIAYEAGDAAERAFWDEAAQHGGDPATASELLSRHDAIARALAEARVHAEQADVQLQAFASDPVRSALSELAFAGLHRVK